MVILISGRPTGDYETALFSFESLFFELIFPFLACLNANSWGRGRLTFYEIIGWENRVAVVREALEYIIYGAGAGRSRI